MTDLPRVPQFGNWENQDNVPYTVFFDKARKGRTGAQMVNPNDPEDTSSVLSDNPNPVGAAPPVSRSRNEPTDPARQGTVQPSHERVRSREEVGMRQYPDPSPNHENMAHRNAREFEQIVDRSALHCQAKVRDSASWDGNRLYESNEGAPAKTQLKPSNNNRSDDNFHKAAVVDGWNKVREEKLYNANTQPNTMVETELSGEDVFPKFGCWNNGPASTKAYTPMVKKTKKRSGWGMSYPTSAEEFYISNCTFDDRETFDDDDDDDVDNGDDDFKVCCFWRSK